MIKISTDEYQVSVEVHLPCLLPGFSVSWVDRCTVQHIRLLPLPSLCPPLFDSTQYRQPVIPLFSWMPS